MNSDAIKKILEKVYLHKLGISEAVTQINPIDDNLPYASLDLQRHDRTGYPETIYGAGKTSDEIIGIFKELTKYENIVLCTKVNEKKAAIVCAQLKNVKYFKRAQLILSGHFPRESVSSKIAIVTAGTSDLAIADEAAITAKAFGNKIEEITDVGVAGIDRLFNKLKIIRQAKVIIVVAGMDGALPSVIAGLVNKPVIAVPTSIGYGASFNGISALLTMLNSCSEGISVVNIDNGFGAGFLGSMINHL